MAPLRKTITTIAFGIGVVAAATAAQARTCETITHTTPYKICQPSSNGVTRCRQIIMTSSRTICINEPEKFKVRQTFKNGQQTARR